MNPYKFEQLVGQLLEAMGYEQVEVTKASGDKGVDVIGQVQVGITTITEVVQVKRMQNTITRPYIDQLRGDVALPQSHSRYAHHHREICGEMCRSGALSGCRAHYAYRRRSFTGTVIEIRRHSPQQCSGIAGCGFAVV